MKKRLTYSAILISVILLILFGVLHSLAPYAILQPPRITESVSLADETTIILPVTVSALDEISLSGYQVTPANDSVRGVIILVHGIGGCKEHFVGLAKELAKRGVASVLFDNRAHGKSGGEFCTYGFYEKRDIQSVINFVVEAYPDRPIGIWGNSLGGAIAIQSMAYDDRIDFGIIESTFTELSQIVYDYKKRILKGVGIKVFSDYALSRAGQIAGFPPEEVKPIESVKQISQPVFLAHGDSDMNISFQYGKALFENLASTQKEFYQVKGGGHFDLYEKGGEAYKNSIMAFIERNLD